MPLSHSSSLRLIASVFGAIFVGFGFNAMLNPVQAMSFFEIYPSSTSNLVDQQILDVLSIVYGIRDVFMGVAIFAAAAYGDRRALGWIVVAAGGAAAVDGWACQVKVGKGEWNHWGYAPVLVVLGGLLLGVLDGA